MRPNDTPQPQPTVNVPTRDEYSLVSPRQTPASADSLDRNPRAATANLARQQIDAIYAGDAPDIQDDPTPPIENDLQQPSQIDTPVPSPPKNPIVKPDSQNQKQFRRFDERKITPLSEKPDGLEIDNPYERTHDDTGLKSSDENWQKYHSAWQQYYQQYFHRYYSDHLSKINAELDSEKKRAEQLAKHGGMSSSSEQAMNDIRSRIRGKVRQRATKVRKSQHFVPI